MTIDHDTELTDIETTITIPAWIEQDITLGDIESICYGGCASGAYMPAVTYHEAAKTMGEHGDDVLDYITDNLDELPAPSDTESWSGMACFYLSLAVELWAQGAAQELADHSDEMAELFSRVV